MLNSFVITAKTKGRLRLKKTFGLIPIVLSVWYAKEKLNTRTVSKRYRNIF